MPASSLIAFAVALSLAAAAPGPSIGALVTRVLIRGFKDVLPFLIAMWLGEALWLTLAISGLAIIAARFVVLFTLFRLLGVAYLLYIAWHMWHGPSEPLQDRSPPTQSAWQTFTAGMMITLGNPKIAVFYLALLPAIVDLGHITLVAWAELTAVMLTVLITVHLSWSAAAVHTRRLLNNRRNVLIANRVSAGVMATAAVAIALK